MRLWDNMTCEFPLINYKEMRRLGRMFAKEREKTTFNLLNLEANIAPDII